MNTLTLYPEIELNDSGMFKVSVFHNIYYEECGNLKGEPILFLHGGPGGRISPSCRQFFDPEHYRIILFDQRGCGKSTPHACLKENTTWSLIQDIETIRKKLGIKTWMIFGGSWGSTLALTYAEALSYRVKALILRGIFLGRPNEFHWLYQDGASNIWPDVWEEFLKPIPEEERHDMLHAYHRRLTCLDEKIQLYAAKHWCAWEDAVSKLVPSFNGEVSEKDALACARIECHYFVSNLFLYKNEILDRINGIRHIPAVIVHGRYDSVCPMKNAWDLHSAWPEADFRIVQDAGHSAGESGIIRELISATDKFRAL